jgi:hypothetical protein
MSERFHPRCHLIRRAIQPTRKPDDDRVNPVFFTGQARHFARGLLYGTAIECRGTQDPDRARQRARGIADRNANASLAHV